MESEDIDRNRFELDVTKTAFLKDSFAISRAGGPTAGSTDKGIACKEKDGKGKRTSARPSSMKVQAKRDRSTDASGLGRENVCTNVVPQSTSLFRLIACHGRIALVGSSQRSFRSEE